MVTKVVQEKVPTVLVMGIAMSWIKNVTANQDGKEMDVIYQIAQAHQTVTTEVNILSTYCIILLK